MERFEDLIRTKSNISIKITTHRYFAVVLNNKEVFVYWYVSCQIYNIFGISNHVFLN